MERERLLLLTYFCFLDADRYGIEWLCWRVTKLKFNVRVGNDGFGSKLHLNCHPVLILTVYVEYHYCYIHGFRWTSRSN
jgi:hypothetical protein